MQKLVVIGAGESGKGAAYLGVKQGWSVFVTDNRTITDPNKAFFNLNDIEWEEGKHTIGKILKADCVVKSPGVSRDIEIIRELGKKGIPVISEIEFAYRYTKAQIVGITGSNGKTTTTTLTYELLRHSGLNVKLAGNVGQSFALDVAENTRDLYVLELSSFQLDDIIDFKPHVSALLNLSPDHLDRYKKKYQNYIDAKFRITENQTRNDYFLYCMDDKDLMENIPNHRIKAKMLPFTQQKVVDEGAYLSDDKLIIQFKKKPSKCPLKK